MANRYFTRTQVIKCHTRQRAFFMVTEQDRLNVLVAIVSVQNLVDSP